MELKRFSSSPILYSIMYRYKSKKARDHNEKFTGWIAVEDRRGWGDGEARRRTNTGGAGRSVGYPSDQYLLYREGMQNLSPDLLVRLDETLDLGLNITFREK